MGTDAMAGRVVVVTGGFGALGRVVASRAAERGASVVRIDHAQAPDRAEAAPVDGVDLGGVDLTDAAAAGRAVEEVARRLGGIDVLVNVAGGFTFATLQDGGADAYAKMFAVNLTTAATVTRAALPELLKRKAARIVNVCALAALDRAGAGMGAYAASKAAVAALTQSLAEELKPHDITVNAVAPSTLDTPANRAAMPDADPSDWVSPEALADVILFLASSDARAVTGAVVPVVRGG